MKKFYMESQFLVSLSTCKHVSLRGRHVVDFFTVIGMVLPVPWPALRSIVIIVVIYLQGGQRLVAQC